MPTLCYEGRRFLEPCVRVPARGGRVVAALFNRRGDDVNKEQPCRKATAPPIPRIDVNELLGSSRELILVHRDAEYRLRLTRNDKLILTK